MRITKRTSAPRGINKRRRSVEDSAMRDPEDFTHSEDEQENAGPSTPKRMRFAPEALPFGLERSDFQALHQQHQTSSQPLQSNQADLDGGDKDNDEDDEWSSGEDRILVELVLEKLKLSKTDWAECARSLGKDLETVSKRWKSLMASGGVGLKKRGASRRGNIHATRR
jgi:hypothetical protein